MASYKGVIKPNSTSVFTFDKKGKHKTHVEYTLEMAIENKPPKVLKKQTRQHLLHYTSGARHNTLSKDVCNKSLNHQTTVQPATYVTNQGTYRPPSNIKEGRRLKFFWSTLGLHATNVPSATGGAKRD